MQPEKPSASLPLLHADKELTLRTSLNADELRQWLRYEPETGLLYWTRSRRGPAFCGAVAGYTDRFGYVLVKFKQRNYRAHRIAFALMNGSAPDIVDHINGNRADNRWSNLRVADAAFNAQNIRRARADNKATGKLGVSVAPSGRFQARIMVNKRSKHLGNFDTPDQAHAAYVEAKRRLHRGCTL